MVSELRLSQVMRAIGKQVTYAEHVQLRAKVLAAYAEDSTVNVAVYALVVQALLEMNTSPGAIIDMEMAQFIQQGRALAVKIAPPPTPPHHMERGGEEAPLPSPPRKRRGKPPPACGHLPRKQGRK